MLKKPIQTAYKGYRFRSRLEARWAVFFNACGVDWEYEPEGYDLGDGLLYLPDFLLHGVEGRAPSDLYVEVKGIMTETDAEKIIRFSGVRDNPDNLTVPTPILVVNCIPDGDTIADIERYCRKWGYDGFPGISHGPCPYSFSTIDGDEFVAHPGINKNGRFELFGDDSSYTSERDDAATLRAYRMARQARFEFGETPKGGRHR